MILGIVGSPRKGRLTDQLVNRALEGAKSAGVESEKVYLIDYKIPFYTEEAKCPEELNRLCEEKCELAKSLIKQGKRIEAAKHVVRAYDTLYF